MNAILQELFRVGVYKRSQGRIVRQVTFAALAVTVLFGLWRLSQTLYGIYSGTPKVWLLHPNIEFGSGLLYYGIPSLALLAGMWIAFRMVNFPAFADFLIAVEAEMNKVSWPSRGELIRASIVVLVSIVFLALLLYAFDWLWVLIFHFIGI